MARTYCWAILAALVTSASLATVSRAGMLTISSTQPMIDWPTAPSCHHDLPGQLPFALFDFQAGQSLATLTGIEVSLTMQNGATGVGEKYHDKLSLGLGSVDTGLKLNGFLDEDELSLSFSLNKNDPGWLSDAAIQSILDDLHADGMLLASILNSMPGLSCLNLYSAFDTTLKLTGSAVPEPKTMLIWMAAMLVGWSMTRQFRQGGAARARRVPVSR